MNAKFSLVMIYFAAVGRRFLGIINTLSCMRAWSQNNTASSHCLFSVDFEYVVKCKKNHGLQDEVYNVLLKTNQLADFKFPWEFPRPLLFITISNTKTKAKYLFVITNKVCAKVQFVATFFPLSHLLGGDPVNSACCKVHSFFSLHSLQIFFSCTIRLRGRIKPRSTVIVVYLCTSSRLAKRNWFGDFYGVLSPDCVSKYVYLLV